MEHVFISYMHENIDDIDRLYQGLTSHGIKVWLDRNDIAPGARWKDAIRKAIREGTFFIACFSKEYNRRNETYMNEELTIAIEELRQRPTDRVWFIPVKLNRCKIPDRNIGGGETLNDLQHVKLYKDWDTGIQRIIEVIQSDSPEPTIGGNASTTNEPLKGFITYSHEDVEKKEELRKHLAVMEQQNELVTWDDGQFTPGDKALQEDILKEVADSDVLLYLVSAASLASENCNKELAEALKREIRVIPIILEHCDWLNHRLSGFEVLPDKGLPITKWEDKSEGWQNVVDGIRSAISRIRSQTSASSGTSEKELRAELAFQHGNVLMMLRQTEVAIKAYSQAIELNSHDANAYSNRSTAYRNNGDFKLAIQDFNRSKQLKPNFRERDYTEGFVKLEMPLEEVLTKITFIVTWLSGEGSDEVIFKGEGVTRDPDRMVLTQEVGEYGRTYYENYTLLTQHAVEGNRYIFVPLAQWGGGSGVFLDINVVDKKTLRTVDEVALGDRTDVRDVVLADAHSETVTITYIKREVKGVEDGYKVIYNPKKAIKRHFRMIQGTLQEVKP